MPESFRSGVVFLSLCLFSPIRLRPLSHEWRLWRGGAPLPIPNREVKPRRDDDTAGDRGKVVRRPPLTESPSATAGGLLCFYISLPCFLFLFFLFLQLISIVMKELLIRSVSGILMGVVLLACVFVSPWTWMALLLFIVVVGTFEMSRLLKMNSL